MAVGHVVAEAALYVADLGHFLEVELVACEGQIIANVERKPGHSMRSAQKWSHSSAGIVDLEKSVAVANRHCDHAQQVRTGPFGSACHLRKHRLVHLGKQNGQPCDFIEIVLVLSESLVVQPMREDALLGLNPHIFNRMIELVTQHEPVQLIHEFFSEDLGYSLGLRFDWRVG